jgi:hypothetical protein
MINEPGKTKGRMAALLTSRDLRTGIAALVVTASYIVLVAILQNYVGIQDSAITIAILLIPILVFGLGSGRLRELTGPGGWGAKFAELEIQVEKTKIQVENQQVLINNLVIYGMSASIFKHLCGVAFLKRYDYDDSTMRREMYFLRDNGYIRPRSHLNFLVFDQLPGSNLVDFAQPTEIGWFYLKLRSKEIPKELLGDEQNLKSDLLASVISGGR